MNAIKLKAEKVFKAHKEALEKSRKCKLTDEQVRDDLRKWVLECVCEPQLNNK